MPPIRRRSRADKRRNNAPIPHEDRRNYVSPDLNVKTQIKHDNLLVWIQNALISSNCFPLRDMIYQIVEESPPKRVIINMSELNYADTTGVSLLINIQKSLQTKKISFILYRVTPRVREILEILNLLEFFDIRDH